MKKQRMFLYVTFVDDYTAEGWTLSVGLSVVKFQNGMQQQLFLKRKLE